MGSGLRFQGRGAWHQTNAKILDELLLTRVRAYVWPLSSLRITRGSRRDPDRGFVLELPAGALEINSPTQGRPQVLPQPNPLLQAGPDYCALLGSWGPGAQTNTSWEVGVCGWGVLDWTVLPQVLLPEPTGGPLRSKALLTSPPSIL